MNQRKVSGVYGWIWRHLPGPLALRIVQAAVLALAVVALLMFVVFPLIAPYMPFSEHSPP